MIVEQPEALNEVDAERGVVRRRRAASYAEGEAAARHELQRDGADRELVRVAQRNLHDTRADLERGVRRGERQRRERILEEKAAVERVDEPRAVEAMRLDALRGIDDRTGTEREHDAKAHG